MLYIKIDEQVTQEEFPLLTGQSSTITSKAQRQP